MWMSLLGCQPVSSISHLIAAGVAFSCAIPMVRLAQGHAARKTALSVYTVCVVIALAVSGVYHSLDRGTVERAIMQKIDHFAIWGLIAGTFTAVHGTMFRRGFWRKGLLVLVWGYAAVGIGLQALWFDVFKGDVGLVLYLGMGSIGLASILKLARRIGFGAVLPLVYSGIFFATGAILEAFDWPVIVTHWIEAHEVFHFAVVIGVALNWMFIRALVVRHLERSFAAEDREFGVEVTSELDTRGTPLDSAPELAAGSGSTAA